MADSPRKPTKALRVILFPLPFQGHINPMIQLANILHSNGFEISILHHPYNSPDPSKNPHFSFHVIPGGLSELQAFEGDTLALFRFLNLDCIGPVPMICSSFSGDQHVNSRYISDVWRLGIKLENGFEREEIESAIKKIMVDGEGQEIRERALCLKEKIQVSLKTHSFSTQPLNALSDLIASFRSSRV